ncbi:tyrosine-protein kinase EpsD [Gracilibacillus boraciitolerans JCM 21714]|uniref:Tyrosine-protein kinase EpsD n=1 Tax=Gracilibacillus boraciitolerans JCM 21714 TaxID=1298598 RepID=W4VPX8_9BACI|nr:tyrosine-protein kinase EpsD [Gracilibacillus boraciitolerans JCM 21714]
MLKRKKQSNLANVRHLITKMNPRSPIAEQFKTIRTNLQFSNIDGELKTILVTSSGPLKGNHQQQPI